MNITKKLVSRVVVVFAILLAGLTISQGSVAYAEDPKPCPVGC
jgi:hypothetical protein